MHVLITIHTLHTVLFRDSGCCWVSNIEGTTDWMTSAALDLGIRSDTHTLNTCPVTTTVSSLRYKHFLSRVALKCESRALQ